MAAVIRAATLAFALVTTAAPAALSLLELESAVAHPPPDARLPAALPFSDLAGRLRTLGQVAGGRPLILLFADYTCRHICSPAAMTTAAALRETGLRPEQDYSLALVGLDPRDGPDQARAFADRTGVPAAYLVGTAGSVAAATRALGYRTVYDRESDQFAHDAVVYIFARDGRLNAMLPEIGLQSDALRGAIAGMSPAPGLTEKVARLCYGLAAAHGRYGRPVVIGLQVLALGTLAALAVAASRLRRRR